MNRYDVLVVRANDWHVEAITGRNLDDHDSTRREASTIVHTNIGPYFVVRAPAGRWHIGARWEDHTVAHVSRQSVGLQSV
jgi:hypothetical protein